MPWRWRHAISGPSTRRSGRRPTPGRSDRRPPPIAPRIASLEAICAEEGREPSSIGRSIGVLVNPFLPAGQRPNVLSGPPEEIARSLRAFRDVGYTQAELIFGPGTIEALEALAPVVDLIRAD